MSVAVLTLSVGGVLLSQFAQLPLFLVGLSLGVKATLIAAAGGVAVTMAAANLTLGLLFAAFVALPVTVLVRQALLARGDGAGGIVWYPPAGLLIAALGLAIVVAATALPSALDPGGAELARAGALAADLVRQMGGAEISPAEAEAMAAAALRFMPGFLGLWFLVTLAVNFALAQGALARLGRALRPSPRLSQLALPLWVSTGAAIAGIGAFFPGVSGLVGANLVLLLSFAFLLAGLAGIHAALAASPVRVAALVALYLTLMLFAPALAAVVLLGIVEPWLGLRERFAGPAPQL
jgi:hypothetical protein